MDEIFHSFVSDDFLFTHADSLPARDIAPHHHDICELLFLKKGDISYMVRGKVYRLTKNCLIITRPSDPHAIKLNTRTEYDRYNVLFNEKLLSSEIYSVLPPNIDVVNFDGNELIRSLFKKFDYYCEVFEGDILKNILMHLTEEVLYNTLIASRNMEPSGSYTINPIINQAIKYIHDNITAPLTINAVCDALYVTKSHLRHLFVKHLNTTPKKYIIAQKLLMVQRELRSGSKPTDIYLTYGFGDYSTFYRDYKNYFGHTPSDEANITITQEITS